MFQCRQKCSLVLEPTFRAQPSSSSRLVCLVHAALCTRLHESCTSTEKACCVRVYLDLGPCVVVYDHDPPVLHRSDRIPSYHDASQLRPAVGSSGRAAVFFTDAYANQVPAIISFGSRCHDCWTRDSASYAEHFPRRRYALVASTTRHQALIDSADRSRFATTVDTRLSRIHTPDLFLRRYD